jgi:energy-coupling factor transporter transmembrane protein EcfT
VSLADILENVRRFLPFVLSLLLAVVALIGWRRHREIGFLVLALWALLIVVNETLIRFGLAPAREFLNQKIGQPETDGLVEVFLCVESLLYHCGLLAAVALLVFRRKHLRRAPAK